MPRYAAFLRGVSPMNAKMPQLKSAFEKAGFTDVKTLLSSGNVVFSAPRASESSLQRRAEVAMTKHLPQGFLTIVRPIDGLREMLASDPFDGFRLVPGSKRIVTFLRDKPKDKLALPIELRGARILSMNDREIFTAYVPDPKGAIFMSLIEKTFGKEVTTRTWDTVAKVVRAASLLVMLFASMAFGQTTKPSSNMNLYDDDKIRLIVRADDFGFSHASNMALETLLNEGTLTAASVIVNTGWLDETVEIIKKHPEVSVGVHVCLNSEWVPYKWGPVLPARDVPSLVDEWGHFFGTRKDLLAHKPNGDEVEKEIRAQVELAMSKGLKISYMDHHMGTAVTTPEMRERFVKVAKEKGLGISRWFGEMQGPLVYSVPPARKTDFLVTELEKLNKPGLYLIVCHTVIKTPEVEVLKDLNITGPKNMADHRQAECDMLCSPRLKQVIKDKGVELVGYDTLREKFLPQMQQPRE